MKKNWKKILILTGGFVVVALTAIKIIGIYERPKRVASMLNIPSLPKSVRIIDCNAPFIPTDVVDTCSIEVDPKDFTSLLRGYAFKETETQETSHSAVITEVGPEFPVVSAFTAEPKEFKYGGHVKVFADQERKRAVVDLYIE